MSDYINNTLYFVEFFIKSDIIYINIAKAFFIFIFFLLLRKVFTKYILRLLHKLTKKTRSNIDDEILCCFQHPLRSFFVVFGIYLGLKYLSLPIQYSIYLNKFLRISILILVLWGLYNFTESSKYLFKDIEKRLNINIDQILIPFIAKTLRLIIVLLGVILIIAEFEYDITGFVTGLGLGGLAFALAAKDTAANLFGGIVIIIDKPFSIGDWILTPSVEGTVEDITFRSTRIRTFANAEVVVPNSKLANESITNWTRMGKRRITFNIGLTYSTSKEKIQNIISRTNEVLINHPQIHQETIFVRFDGFSNSSLDIFLYFFTKTTKWGEFLKVKEEINFIIMDIVREEGASFAFPSQSLYIESIPNDPGTEL